MFNTDVYTLFNLTHVFGVKSKLPRRNKHDAKQHATQQNTNQHDYYTQTQHQENVLKRLNLQYIRVSVSWHGFVRRKII